MSVFAPFGRDRELDASLVRLAVEGSFPELAPVRVEWFGEGWDNDVYLVNGEWLFRFPKRRDVAATVESEVRLQPLLADALSVEFPRFVWIAEAGQHFPYPFVGYRPVEGTPGYALPDLLAPAAERRLARQIGRALTELHAVPVDRARALGAPEHDFTPEGLLAGAREAAPGLASVLPPDHFAAYAAFLDGAVVPPSPSPLLRFTHGDLVSEHLLFDPATYELTGIIDFADQGLRDPAIDFVGLFHWRGEAFVRMVLDSYTMEPDPGLLDRVRFDTVVASGIWLAEAIAAQSSVDVERHLRAFNRSIGPVLREMLRGR